MGSGCSTAFERLSMGYMNPRSSLGRPILPRVNPSSAISIQSTVLLWSDYQTLDRLPLLAWTTHLGLQRPATLMDRTPYLLQRPPTRAYTRPLKARWWLPIRKKAVTQTSTLTMPRSSARQSCTAGGCRSWSIVWRV